ncbi:Imm53 family immunity protein, partial [Streptomyces niveus]
YAQQCGGEWEHERGVRIATLDNPGWTVSIDLEETELEERDYSRQEINRLTLFRTWATTVAPPER